jgi:dihydrofolate reductase
MESTRRIVTFNWMTANGYFAAADGNLDWVVPDADQAKAAVDNIPLFDTVLFGRRTYELSSSRNSRVAPTTLPRHPIHIIPDSELRNTTRLRSG